ncbi:MAG: 16S rRNA (cytidine(1402)-2'-O)-methyltransferase [Betaproteobacteria bacterium]|nr:16S rRNA (cytidine(1402)-2'-O)-methyltransferase [Betaproteobacteria bacterium]
MRRERRDAMEAGQLFVVATPIGNLDDITLRALKVLASAEVIAAEDTRNTATLLARHGIGTRAVALHAHNEAKMIPKALAWLREGKRVALVCDAGTPAISDPGAQLVAGARAAGFRVTPIPGPNAAVAGVSASGLPDAPFLVYGFLPPRPAARRRALQPLAALPYTLVFYEAPHRILESVDDLEVCLGGERALVLARELTKVFESIHCCPLSQAQAWLRAEADRRRGEFVLIVSGAPKSEEAARPAWETALEVLLAELPLAQAVRLTCALSGAKRNQVYARALTAANAQKAIISPCKS